MWLRRIFMHDEPGKPLVALYWCHNDTNIIMHVACRQNTHLNSFHIKVSIIVATNIHHEFAIIQPKSIERASSAPPLLPRDSLRCQKLAAIQASHSHCLINSTLPQTPSFQTFTHCSAIPSSLTTYDTSPCLQSST